MGRLYIENGGEIFFSKGRRGKGGGDFSWARYELNNERSERSEV